jgi:hypothetical protein
MSRKKRRATDEETDRVPVLDEASVRQNLAKWLRDRFGDNASEASRQLGIPRSTIQQWMLRVQYDGLPSSTNLLQLAAHGLSIDWLLTGRGSMQSKRFEPTTDPGRALDLLRPHLQRAAGLLGPVGEWTDNQAFDLLIAENSAEQLLARAAEGLLPLYRDRVTRVQSLAFAEAGYHAAAAGAGPGAKHSSTQSTTTQSGQRRDTTAAEGPSRTRGATSVKSRPVRKPKR